MDAEVLREEAATIEVGGAGNVRSASCRPPVLADTVIDRPGPVARLAASAPGSLVVLAAPAGYGKTIAVAQWERSDPRPFAWVGIDALDADPAHLVAHVATALAERELLDVEDLRFLSGPGRSPQLELVPALLEMLDRSDPFVLVVDDVHLLGVDGRATLAAIVQGQPPTSVIALVGRTTPIVGLPRRRMEGSTLELGPVELALGVDEARDVFRRLGVPVSDARLADVVDRCEGWAGGIHLSALAMRDGDRAAAAPVTGRARLLADYLVEEVLAGLDPDLATFLEEASILEPMSASLLDSVLGRGDSGPHLAAIEESGNLFLVPLDDDRTWYRFHHLFGELLTARLGLRDRDRLRTLHRRASDHFEGRGELDRAIHHALGAGDRARAAALVQRDAIALTFAGRPGILARRLGMLDEVTVTTTAEGAVAAAWAALAEGDADAVRSALVDAAASDTGAPLPDGSASVAVASALLAGLTGDGGLENVLRNTSVAVDAGDPDSNPWWGMALTVRATALIQLGRYEDARRDLLDAVDRMPAIPGFQAGALMLLGWLHLRDGDLAGASTFADRGRRITDRHELANVVPLLVVYSTDALISARSGDHDRAHRCIEATNVSLARLGRSSPRTHIFGHQVLAEAHHALQEGAEARHHLTQARRILRQHPLSAALGAENDRIAELLAEGPTGSSLALTPLTAAERRVLPLLATHLSLPQIAEQLHVSRNTVKSHCVSVYRKLGVTSRAAAVSEARRLGLVDP